MPFHVGRESMTVYISSMYALMGGRVEGASARAMLFFSSPFTGPRGLFRVERVDDGVLFYRTLAGVRRCRRELFLYEVAPTWRACARARVTTELCTDSARELWWF